MKIIIAVLMSAMLTNSCFGQEDCSGKLKTEKDKFTGEATIYTPLLASLGMTKIIKDTAIYFLNLTVRGSTIVVGEKGAYVLFEDGSKFIREDAKVKAKVNPYGSGYLYDAFIYVTKDEAEVFSKKIITDVKLYIYAQESKPKASEEFRCQVEAILKTN